MIERDFQVGIDLGLPVVYGESVFATSDGEGDGGYHNYPSINRVRKWIGKAGFSIKEEDEATEYHHFWVQKGAYLHGGH